MEANTVVTVMFNVNLSLSSPPLACVVPNLNGKKLNNAKLALIKAHCEVGKITKLGAWKGKKLGSLVVKSFWPVAGATRPAGTKVNLKLGSKLKKRNG